MNGDDGRGSEFFMLMIVLLLMSLKKTNLHCLLTNVTMIIFSKMAPIETGLILLNERLVEIVYCPSGTLDDLTS